MNRLTRLFVLAAVVVLPVVACSTTPTGPEVQRIRRDWREDSIRFDSIMRDSVARGFEVHPWG